MKVENWKYEILMDVPCYINAHIVWVDAETIDFNKASSPVGGQIDHLNNIEEDVFLIYKQLMYLSGHFTRYIWTKRYLPEELHEFEYTLGDNKIKINAPSTDAQQ